jgi:hypothetical protein
MNRVAAVVSAFVVVGASWAEAPKPTLADLSWLAGCWEGGRPESKYEEQWMAPRGQTMMGMSRTVSQEKTVAFEFLRIHQEADGIYYTSIPSGQTQASFKLIERSDRKVVFENPDHDFPQRIMYTLGEGGELMVTIEGMSKGALKQIEFPMRRATCK